MTRTFYKHLLSILLFADGVVFALWFYYTGEIEAVECVIMTVIFYTLLRYLDEIEERNT